MRYFLLKLDDKFTHVPEIINWFNTFDVRKIYTAQAEEIPYRNIFEIRPCKMLHFTDIVIYPFLLVSKLMKDIIKVYEPDIEYKDVVLLDKENKQYQLYYLPVLDSVDCLANKSQLNMDRSVLIKAVFQLDKIGDRSIFRIDKIKNTYIAIRLDLAESLLRRKVSGIFLEPIEIIGEKIE